MKILGLRFSIMRKGKKKCAGRTERENKFVIFITKELQIILVESIYFMNITSNVY